MSKHNQEVRICDLCGTKAISESTTYGGHPFSGWVSISIHGGSTSLESLSKKRNFDFCSVICLIRHFNNND